MSSKQLYEFGPYRIDPGRQRLLRGTESIPLTSKAFETLLVLVEHCDQVISKDELMQKLWPDTYVDEANLTKHISMVRKALGENAKDHRYILTLPGRGYRLAEKVRTIPVDETDVIMEGRSVTRVVIEQTERTEETAPAIAGLSRKWISAATVALVFILAGSFLVLRSHRIVPLGETDWVLVSDFVNSTGDPVFDDTLKVALSVSLRQSPFLNVLPDSQVSKTLQLMTLPTNAQLTPQVARELCQRTSSKVYVAGAIVSLGSEYVLGLKAVGCQNGETIAQEQVTAVSEEKVLDALGEAASRVRRAMGESLPSVQKFDVPLAEATTSSLEALKNYSMGIKVVREKGDAPSIPFFRRAIELDPNFPMAYAGLSVRYDNLGQTSLALEYATKAYGLRDRVTELEKLRIAATYFGVTGQLQNQLQDYDLWIANYPRDGLPHRNRGVTYCFIGQWEKALPEFQQAMRLAPDSVVGDYASLGSIYIGLNRLGEAKTTLNQALASQLDDESLRVSMYYLAFLQGDATQMEQQVAWGVGQAGIEDALLSVQSDTEAFNGRLSRARELSRKAVDSAIRADAKETAAYWRVNAALREAELGDAATAKEGITEALTSSSGRDVQLMAALALARVGDTPRAAALVKSLEKSYATNTILKSYWLPAINSAIELNKGNSSQALMYLEAAAPYQLGNPPPMQIGTLYPVYLRGQAYLLAHDGSAAAAEFQKVLDHRGIVLNFATGALAHLQLGRAYAMTGDTAKAKTAYQDFLTLWKGADPDIPVLKQAKAEYAKLE